MNYNGELGDGGKTGLTPYAINDFHGVRTVTAGMSHTCALAHDGSVWCWGANPHGVRADNVRESSMTPKAIIGLFDVIAIAAGDYHTCALTRDGCGVVLG